MHKKYHAAFETAEKYLKEAEIFVKDMSVLMGTDLQGLLFPAVNELRYAGCHAAKALALEGDDQKSAYESALRHCQRACYDAFDIQIQFCVGQCRMFQEDYKLVVISAVIPDYQRDCLELSRINQTKTRSESREQDWESLVPIVGDLKRICEKWFVGREELNKVLDEKRNARLHQYLNSSATLISAACAAIMFILYLLK